MSEQAQPSVRSARLPAAVQAAAVAVALAVVAAVSLTARQPSPPSVAEYAPQAVAQIKEAPPEQAADLGQGSAPTTSTTAPGSAAGGGPGRGPDGRDGDERFQGDRTAVRRCVGEPARQTEDPQSPPCVDYFDPARDNGGPVGPGVTRDTVRIYYTPDFFEDAPTVTTDLVGHFNRRYVFYGRKLELVQRDASPASPQPANMQQDAQFAQEENVFASLNYVGRGGAEFHYYDALAKRRIVSVSHRVTAGSTTAHFRRQAPYQWSVVPAVDQMLRNYGQFVCASLAGKSPRFAGPAIASARERVFGAVVQVSADGSRPDTGPLRDELGRCGARLAVELESKVTGEATRTGTGVVLGLTDEDVTSVICLCDAVEARSTLMPAASSQGYQPEWLLGTYLDNDLDNSMNDAPPDQASHVLGLSFRNKLLPKQEMPFYWAIKESNPENDAPGGRYYALQARYASLLLLASGIQLAGPRLTPDSFAAGLYRARFANPGAGGPPYWQAPVGFTGGRHTMMDDAMAFWFERARRSTVDPEATGAVCHVGRGSRWRLGGWADIEDGFFAGPCP